MSAGPIKKWRALSGQEKILLMQFIFWLPWIAFSLKFFGYLRTRNFLLRRNANIEFHQANTTELARAERSAKLLAIAGRHGLISATCLRQSVLLEYWLKRQGLNAEIKIGVRKEADLFDAHAWVELNGIPLAQDDLEHHQVLQ